eukprot:CAMPEP_0114251738 /NCGR_PEP_ID=MMETSP0058-20121206/15438_1 /TAXON_ID=36894 /ORGANISM="Pyramimonas parkeae, CCMP726" /LENGTH=460 /DNA_ID=CAMNT_0001365575 /DNA_START=428 /DNA_END=1810 /DNA_ORIENTATION=+
MSGANEDDQNLQSANAFVYLKQENKRPLWSEKAGGADASALGGFWRFSTDQLDVPWHEDLQQRSLYNLTSPVRRSTHDGAVGSARRRGLGRSLSIQYRASPLSADSKFDGGCAEQGMGVSSRSRRFSSASSSMSEFGALAHEILRRATLEAPFCKPKSSQVPTRLLDQCAPPNALSGLDMQRTGPVGIDMGSSINGGSSALSSDSSMVEHLQSSLQRCTFQGGGSFELSREDVRFAEVSCGSMGMSPPSFASMLQVGRSRTYAEDPASRRHTTNWSMPKSPSRLGPDQHHSQSDEVHNVAGLSMLPQRLMEALGQENMLGVLERTSSSGLETRAWKPTPWIIPTLDSNDEDGTPHAAHVVGATHSNKTKSRNRTTESFTTKCVAGARLLDGYDEHVEPEYTSSEEEDDYYEEDSEGWCGIGTGAYAGQGGGLGSEWLEDLESNIGAKDSSSISTPSTTAQ